MSNVSLFSALNAGEIALEPGAGELALLPLALAELDEALAGQPAQPVGLEAALASAASAGRPSRDKGGAEPEMFATWSDLSPRRPRRPCRTGSPTPGRAACRSPWVIA